MIQEHWSGVKKIVKIYKCYKLNLYFPVDRKHSYNLSIKKMIE